MAVQPLTTSVRAPYAHMSGRFWKQLALVRHTVQDLGHHLLRMRLRKLADLHACDMCRVN